MATVANAGKEGIDFAYVSFGFGLAGYRWERQLLFFLWVCYFLWRCHLLDDGSAKQPQFNGKHPRSTRGNTKQWAIANLARQAASVVGECKRGRGCAMEESYVTCQQRWVDWALSTLAAPG